MWLRLVKLFLFIISFYFTSSFCTKKTDGFSIRRLQTSLSLTNQGSETLADDILKQPFHYLDRGGQMFVFISEDQKYVLKFFKNGPNSSTPLKKHHLKRLNRVMRDIEGYLLAFKKLPEESGLIFLKLDTQTPFNQEITLFDKLGIQHRVDLQKTLFAIQKKGEPLISYLKTADNVQDVFDSVKDLIAVRKSQGIDDHDSHFHKNIGFIGGKPAFLDPGKFVEESSQEETFPPQFVTWIKMNYPEVKL